MVAFHVDGGRNHHILWYQRMPCLDQLKGKIILDLGPCPVNRHGILRPGEYHVQLIYCICIPCYTCNIRLYPARKHPEDPLDLCLLLEHELLDVVVQVHEAHGLDEQRLAGGALVMDQARDAALVFRFYRQNVPVTAYGIKVVLQEFFVGPDKRLDLFLDTGSLVLQCSPDSKQLCARLVRDFIFADYRCEYLIFQHLEGCYTVQDIPQAAVAVRGTDVFLEFPAALQYVCYPQESGGSCRASLSYEFQCVPYIIDALERCCSLGIKERCGLLCLRQRPFDILPVLVWLHPGYHIRSCGADRIRFDLLNYLEILELFHALPVHYSTPLL